MYDIEKLFEEMRDAIPKGPVQIKELKEKGVPVIGTYCTFTPWELVNAMGGVSVSLCSTSDKPIEAAEKHLPRNLCPLIKSSYGFALTDTCPYFHFCDLVIGETTCDGKKKMYEYLNELRPVHVMQLPQTPNGRMSLPLWKDEVLRLKEELEKRFGVKITDEKLARSIELRNRMNRVMMDFYDLAKLPTPAVTGREIMTVSDYFKFSFDYEETMAKVKELTQKLRENYESGERRVSEKARRILITGCPTGKSLQKVADAVETPDNGGVVIGFENCGNLKCSDLPVSTDKAPLDALAEKYLGIPCSVMSPNESRIKLLRRFCDEYKADGVVDIILQACHTYNVETRSIRLDMQKLGVPYTSIETDYSQGDAAQLATRMGAFIEML